MVQRHFWQELVEQAWRQRSVVWLPGVCRVGKTFLHSCAKFEASLAVERS